MLVGFSNKGTDDFIVETIDASFRYPQDYSYHIQNFTGTSYNRIVRPSEEASFQYAFHPHESYGGRPFGLTVLMLYKDAVSVFRFQNLFSEDIFFPGFNDSEWSRKTWTLWENMSENRNSNVTSFESIYLEYISGFSPIIIQIKGQIFTYLCTYIVGEKMETLKNQINFRKLQEFFRLTFWELLDLGRILVFLF